MSDFDDSSRDLYIRGMSAARTGDFAEAQRYLEWALRLNPDLERRVDCLYWLSESTRDPAEKRRWLDEALANNPSDMRCRRSLAVLNGELQAADIVDPDRVEQPAGAAEPAKAAADRFICPQCGGRMTYAPDGKSLTCEYCEARQSASRAGVIPGGAASPAKGASPSSPAHPGQGSTDAGAAENFLIAMATRKGHIHPANRQTFNCQGCGIEFILPPDQLSITCPYCGSAYVVHSSSSRELIDPHAILPFQVNEAQAQAALKTWFAHLKISRDAGMQVECGAGIYLPAWSFEMAGQLPWSCEVEESRDHWVPETGDGIVYHASVVVAASTRLCAECAAELREFDLKQAVPFEESYLANWPAETYQVNLGDASLEARSWTFDYEKSHLRGQILGPVRNLTYNSLGITIESFKLVLLPLWLTHYHLDQERFEVVVNAVSGKVRGQHPLTWLEKIFK